MIETLKEIDTQWFLWINGHHCTAMDWTMWVLSQHWFFAAVLVLAFFALTTRSFQLSPFTFHIEKRWWFVLLAIGLCFLLADQGSVQLFKNTVGRLRPCHALDDVYMFRTGCGGKYGFVSSHAANAFAIVTFLWMRYKKKWSVDSGKWAVRITLIGLLVWALATCYSRAYLGKHYPGDLICGALFGIVVGLIVWWLCGLIEKSFLKVKQNE